MCVCVCARDTKTYQHVFLFSFRVGAVEKKAYNARLHFTVDYIFIIKFCDSVCVICISDTKGPYLQILSLIVL